MNHGKIKSDRNILAEDWTKSCKVRHKRHYLEVTERDCKCFRRQEKVSFMTSVQVTS